MDTPHTAPPTSSASDDLLGMMGSMPMPSQQPHPTHMHAAHHVPPQQPPQQPQHQPHYPHIPVGMPANGGMNMAAPAKQMRATNGFNSTSATKGKKGNGFEAFADQQGPFGNLNW